MTVRCVYSRQFLVRRMPVCEQVQSMRKPGLRWFVIMRDRSGERHWAAVRRRRDRSFRRLAAVSLLRLWRYDIWRRKVERENRA